ncbi:putative (di)nucleoside polyphosphate hydrolase [Pseudochelatococcus lubricantis]|uniref:RNA pyrophosphohydrolase n=1 Tax=Pseudochelatococcus lubricantis TaxID=1538102 RepID=A0ABX0V1W4_9HYPH|nr:RNA pyrophosphohydrolase [Pseudochelatococcus lubricantis]NIJ58603.1 putative (di)nucleoside polyphosphate hydrolase [Pseudochelatococcus lubricantis]
MSDKVNHIRGKVRAEDLPYRACVGVMLLNKVGRVFIGSRQKGDIAEGTVPPAYTWQMPQGGVDKHEDLLDAARRELFEETNVRSVEVLAQTPDWLTYDLPEDQIGIGLRGKFRGQKQKWFAMRFTGDESEIDVLHPGDGSVPPEFDAWRWEEAQHLPELIVPFKRRVYEQVVAHFAALTHIRA